MRCFNDITLSHLELPLAGRAEPLDERRPVAVG
jgi:hypothetical protein